MAYEIGDVVILGAGRVGVALALRLHEVGHPVSGVVTRSADSRRRVQLLLPWLDPISLDSGAVAEAGTIVLCVADDELPGVVQLVAPRLREGRLVAHTSGRYGLAVLEGLRGLGAAVHPVMTFAGSASDVANLPGIAYGVTAEDEALVAATALVAVLGGVVELVPDERRPTYHAALSHAANHLVTLIADAADLLRAAGVADTSRVLGPIAAAALANTLALDPTTGRPAGDGALTGPVVRGDAGTVDAHLAALERSPARASYRAMAARTAERAQAAGRLDPVAARAILDLLASAGGSA